MSQIMVDKSREGRSENIIKNANGKPYIEPAQQRLVVDWSFSEHNGIR